MRSIIVFVSFLLINGGLLAQSNHIYQKEGIAIDGYDPVTYFTKGKAIEGSDKIRSEYDGVTYYFSSESSKNMFDENPTRFLPQYGGWCAYAMGDSGEKVKIDPETFKIIDGKLYLFYNFYFTNTLTKWNRDESNLKQKADQNWKKVID